MNPLESAGAIGQTLLQMLESRIELFGVEYRMEKARLAALVGVACLAASSLVLAGVAGIVALAMATPEKYQTFVMAAVCFFFLVILGACIGAAFYLMDQKRTPFSETRQELRKDVACLSSVLKKKK
ncbi:phage holin family protein [Cerasicoccus fimbriatus]|uniref:phage holin family protein n=1 Tax=Cerasicoccus fimbriatus TaxID=3014554 RepID=UPI0022B2CAF5|nr:phage holin family protein [Cerasicoccus sp. TK19100]